MSSTSKARLQTVYGVLDLLFANAHRDDRPALVKELREYISRQNKGGTSQYDDHHSSAITAPLNNA